MGKGSKNREAERDGDWTQMGKLDVLNERDRGNKRG